MEDQLTNQLHEYVPHQYREGSQGPSPRMTQNNHFNLSSGLSITNQASPQNYASTVGGGSQPWLTHGRASFATGLNSNDLSAGIPRGTAFDMQNEAELQLRHQIRDTV